MIYSRTLESKAVTAIGFDMVHMKPFFERQVVFFREAPYNSSKIKSVKNILCIFDRWWSKVGKIFESLPIENAIQFTNWRPIMSRFLTITY